jgi:hypothetical protein
MKPERVQLRRSKGWRIAAASGATPSRRVAAATAAGQLVHRSPSAPPMAVLGQDLRAADAGRIEIGFQADDQSSTRGIVQKSVITRVHRK